MAASPDVFGVGSLTDVAGVHVGHHQRSGRGWLTGTTVVLVPAGAAAAVDVRGGGPGTRETDALDPRNLVDRLHGICLSGGSAYGLAAADGVMSHLESLGLGVPVGSEPTEVVPVVPAAVIFDLGRGGRFANRPDPGFGLSAARAARSRRPARGTVGAGTGARAGGMQGGVGMASAQLTIAGTAVRVAALAVVNASGAVIDPSTGAPWLPPSALRRPTRQERNAIAGAIAPAPPPPLNTTIGVVATDADIDRAEAGRMAQSAHDGLARAIRPSHSLLDGDTIFALATGAQGLPTDRTGLVRSDASRAHVLNALFALAADTFAAACTDAVLTATSTIAHRAYRDLCPSAYRSVPLPDRWRPGARGRRHSGQVARHVVALRSRGVQVFGRPDEARAWSCRQRIAGKRIAVVPTMGALHGGHLALVHEAARRADAVIVTIFVNPLQFNQPADFDRYPRPIDEDLDICRSAGVDAVYAPTASVMYPTGFQTHVEPGDLADRLEGPMRPGHFRGVTTVVTKLLAATLPDTAVFGRKDYQQLAIVRRMVSDLDLGVEVVGVDIVREADGLALSSRNVRLAPDDRTAAVAIHRGLRAAVDAHASGERDATRLRAACLAVLEAEPRATTEYVEVVDADALTPLETLSGPAVILAAVWFGDVRLIDNMPLD